jgi:hypothetical protein
MTKRRPMYMFGIRCIRCDHEIIAPHRTELLDDRSFVIFGTARAATRDSKLPIDLFASVASEEYGGCGYLTLEIVFGETP